MIRFPNILLPSFYKPKNIFFESNTKVRIHSILLHNAKCHDGDPIKEYKMGAERGMHGSRQKCVQDFGSKT
jgi:hypothetical protein